MESRCLAQVPSFNLRDHANEIAMRRQFVLTPMGLQPADNTHVSTRVAQSSGALTSHAEAEQGPASNEDTSFLSLREIAREVHELGAKHLASRHGAASFESSRLLKIGIKLPKKQRIGIDRYNLNLAYFLSF